jgi:hypothetical protein
MAISRYAVSSGMSSPRTAQWWRRYGVESRRPLHCLLFLLPAVAVHELGAWWGATGGTLIAPTMIQWLLGWFGIVGSWVPAVVLVFSMLVWLRIRRDRWRVRGWVLVAMAVESVLMAAPLLVLVAVYRPDPAAPLAADGLAQVVRALGAGIYEELVFRFLLISGLVWLLGEVLGLRGAYTTWVAAALAAVLFSLCHFEPVGMDAFTWGAFWYRLVAGAYLGVVFVGRGFGVAAGCHGAFNVVLVGAFGHALA